MKPTPSQATVPEPRRRSSAERGGVHRRVFTTQAALAILSGVTVTVVGCGSDLLPPADVEGEISANHGHSARITSVQLAAGDAFTLNIRGSAGHNHTVQITTADLFHLRSKEHAPLVKLSSRDLEHDHAINFV